MEKKPECQYDSSKSRIHKMKNKKRTLEICMTGIAATLVACNGPAESNKPNIVIFLADDMGWGDINANGNNQISTPVLNRLMSESLSLDRFYVCPVSAPTRAQMLTGRYSLRTGVSSVTRGFENMRSDEVTLAEVLKDNGYATGCFGKWHNGRYWPQHPNRQGFDEYVGFPVGHLGYYFDAFYLHNDEEKQSEGYTSDYFTLKALDFIERNKDSSFLCYVPYNVPHSPFQVPSEYFEKYIATGLDSTLASVYGMVENMDENIGKVLERLDKLELTENTIVIFFSDNGPNTERYNGGMKGRKGSVDEGGVRVPFYIKWPGKIKTGIVQQLAQDIDIMPTLLGLCEIDNLPVRPLDGMDLSSIIKAKGKEFDRLIFSRQGNQVLENCNSSVRNDRYKLVLTRKDTMLYDLKDDPAQKNNIFNKESEIGKPLLAELVRHNTELISAYEPVTTIEAGFAEEKSFTLPVQDAALSGKIKYSSIHPNQSHTENWIQNGDSIRWTLNINTPGIYKVEMQYGCPAGETGSSFLLNTNSGTLDFSIEQPFNSMILPEMDYVKRTESVERTWGWMNAGNISLTEGTELITLKLVKKNKNEAGLIKALRFSKI
jgi:arylsulfatase A-like enzyme